MVWKKRNLVQHFRQLSSSKRGEIWVLQELFDQFLSLNMFVRLDEKCRSTH